MNKEKNSKKEKRKLEIKELAEIGTEKINENKFLLETISVYQSQLNFIKSILDKKSKLSINNSVESSNIIKKDFISFYEQLKKSVENLREVNKKLLQKFEMNNNIIFDESSLSKLDLNKNRIDIFILDYEIKQQNDIIKKLNESIINSKRHSIFRENKRESETSRNAAANYINNDNLYAQRDLQIECRNYNKSFNRNKKKIINIEKMKEIKKSLSQYINYSRQEKNKNNTNNRENKIFNKKKNDVKKSDFFSFQVTKKKSINKKKSNNNDNNDFNSIAIDELGKKYQFGGDSLMINEEEENNKEQTYISNNNNYNSLFFSNNSIKSSIKEKDKKKKVKQKFNFLTFDELFDLDNEEGEKELIIQEELHSDDEVVFEKKIKNKNRINTEYLSKIKKQVPGLYLNQIEFNKKKVINEADLYSLQRREFNKQNIEENIKTMKKKVKIMKRRKDINIQKLRVLIEFDKKAQEQYESLKKVKVQSSMKDYDISFMKKEFYNYRSKNYKNDAIPEEEEKTYAGKIKNKIGDNKYQDEEGEDGDDLDDYSDEMRKRHGKTKRNNNNIMMTEDDFEDNKKNSNGNKYIEYDNDNKAKSK